MVIEEIGSHRGDYVKLLRAIKAGKRSSRVSYPLLGSDLMRWLKRIHVFSVAPDERGGGLVFIDRSNTDALEEHMNDVFVYLGTLDEFLHQIIEEVRKKGIAKYYYLE